MVTEPEERETDGGPADAPPEPHDMSGIPEDPRLASGVPEAARADELDFIEMTGLTRPPGPVDDASEQGFMPPTDTIALLGGTSPQSRPPTRARAIEAADAFDEEEDFDDDDALTLALNALAAVPEPTGAVDAAPDVEALASKIREEILDELRDDLASVRAHSPQAEPESEPASPDDRGPLPVNPNLREAERLIQELQEQPREATPAPVIEPVIEPANEPEPDPAPETVQTPLEPAEAAAPKSEAEIEAERRHGERRSVSRMYAERHRDVHGYLAAYTGEPARPPSDEPEVEVDFSNDPPKHRHRTLTKKQRNTRRALTIILVIAFIGAAAVVSWPYAEPYFQNAGTLYREAEQLEVNGKARESSNRYRAFLARYPNDPRAPEALFRAGFVLQVEEAGPASPRALADSVELFERFIEQYPNHDKAHRARTLRGILLYRLGNHEEAVTTLRDPALHLADPAAALPVWRTLGQAYQALGDIASARSEFLKAASLQGNYNADEDYEALGRMYKRLAEQLEDGEARTEYLLEGISYLRQAAMVAGVSRDRQQTLQREIDFLQREVDDSRGDAARQTARADQEPVFWQLRDSGGDPTEPAVEPADALTILDGLEGALPAAGIEPGVSADAAFDAETGDTDNDAAVAQGAVETP